MIPKFTSKVMCFSQVAQIFPPPCQHKQTKPNSGLNLKLSVSDVLQTKQNVFTPLLLSSLVSTKVKPEHPPCLPVAGWSIAHLVSGSLWPPSCSPWSTEPPTPLRSAPLLVSWGVWNPPEASPMVPCRRVPAAQRPQAGWVHKTLNLNWFSPASQLTGTQPQCKKDFCCCDCFFVEMKTKDATLSEDGQTQEHFLTKQYIKERTVKRH